MRLSACYTIFNGLELLEKSIEQIYDHVDVIIIYYQQVSNLGEHNPFVFRLVAAWESDPKVFVAEFKPDLKLQTKENERVKHRLMISFARGLDCTHFLLAATDHYYDTDEFAEAKITAAKYDVTLTAMYTYYKYPTWRMDPIEDYYFPFICKLLPGTTIDRIPGFPLRVDPSVQINTYNNWYLFKQEEIMLHHFTMVRDDIESKFRNAAASIRWSEEDKKRFLQEYNDVNVGDKVSYFGGREIVETIDVFKLGKSN